MSFEISDFHRGDIVRIKNRYEPDPNGYLTYARDMLELRGTLMIVSDIGSSFFNSEINQWKWIPVWIDSIVTATEEVPARTAVPGDYIAVEREEHLWVVRERHNDLSNDKSFVYAEDCNTGEVNTIFLGDNVRVFRPFAAGKQQDLDIEPPTRQELLSFLFAVK